MPEYLSPTEARQNENAGWAKTFRPASTNLSQRKRYAEDIAQGSINEDTRAAAAGEAAMVQNKGLRDLVFGRANQQLARQKQDLAEERLNFDKNKRAFDEEFKIRDEQLKRKNMEISMEDKLRDTEIADMVMDHTKALKNDVHTLVTGGQVEGTPAFAKAVIASILRNPNAQKEVVANIFKAARIQGDPDAIKAQAMDMGLEPSGARFDPQSGELIPTFSRPLKNTSSSGSSGPSGPDNSAKIERFKDTIAKLDPEKDAAKIARIEQRMSELKPDARPRDMEAIKEVPAAETTAPSPAASASTTVSTREQFDALPSGAEYVGKDGRRFRKP